ncbi:hypothetical protein [Planktothrix serta]
MGTSRVTITRLINQCEREGKIVRKGNLLKICLNLL